MGSEPNDNGVIENVEGCLPCPFCGGTKIYIQVFYEHVDRAIGCDTCHAGWSMGNFNSNTEAIAAWNRRDRRWQGDDVVDTWQRCPICYGTGRKDGFTLGDPCPTCLGKRIISVVDGKPPKDMKETP